LGSSSGERSPLPRPGSHREQLAAHYAEKHLSVETAGADGFITR